MFYSSQYKHNVDSNFINSKLTNTNISSRFKRSQHIYLRVYSQTIYSAKVKLRRCTSMRTTMNVQMQSIHVICISYVYLGDQMDLPVSEVRS